MPTKDEHLKKATENEDLASTLHATGQASINWKLVILFYAGLHYVEAYLAKSQNKHLRSHTTRDNFVTKESNLHAMRSAYFHLKYFAYNARYEPDCFIEKDVTEAMIDFTKIKSVIQKFI